MKPIHSVLATLLLAALSCQAAAAESKPSVLIMGLDADQGGTGESVVVARDTRVFNQVLEALTEALTQRGLPVYDERHITLDSYQQDRVQRGEAELLDIARAIRKPAVDDVVLFTVYAGARRLAYTTEVTARITARIVDVRSGEKRGSFEVASPRGWRVPPSCEGDCLLEAIGRSTEGLAGDLGTLLAAKLAAQPSARKPVAAATPPQGFTLQFEGFTPDDLAGAEEYLAAFRGHRAHHRLPGNDDTARFAYDGDADVRSMENNLHFMLDRLGLEGQVTYRSTDRTFRIARTGALNAGR